MFGGNWGKDGDKIFGDDGKLAENIYTVKNGNDVVVSSDDMTFGNKVMRTLGMVSVAYTLGTSDAKVDFAENVRGIGFGL